MTREVLAVLPRGGKSWDGDGALDRLMAAPGIWLKGRTIMTATILV